MTSITLQDVVVVPCLIPFSKRGNGQKNRRNSLPFSHRQRFLFGCVLSATVWFILPGNTIYSMDTAQWLDLSAARDNAIEVLADQRIEWQRNARCLVARGNARLSHGNMIVHAARIAARYRADGKATGLAKGIYWLQADGNVCITLPTETASGDVANYNMDKHLLILIGHPARLKTSKEEVITANKDITYYQDQQIAVARGDVYVMIREGRMLRANEIIVNLPGSKQKKIKITQVTANGDVRIKTPKEIIRGEHGTYNTETDIATLTGSVKITHGENQLNGAYAVFNLKTGQSWLYAAAPSSKRQVRIESGERVKILIVPDRKTNKHEIDKGTMQLGTRTEPWQK